VDFMLCALIAYFVPSPTRGRRLELSGTYGTRSVTQGCYV